LVKSIKSFFEQLVGIMEMTGLNVRVHALYQIWLMDFKFIF
jgi:hypothetical protein